MSELKEQIIKPTIELNRWLKLTDFLICQNINKEMYELGKSFRKAYTEQLPDSPVTYEESSSLDSPESYDNDTCKSGVCD